MRRRSLLTSLSAGLGFLAGCSTTLNRSSDPPPADNTTERPTKTPESTGSPGPTTESRFVGTTVPALPHDGETRWFHNADRDTPIFVRPSVEQTELPAQVEFTLVNNSQDSIGCVGWHLYKLENGKWFQLRQLYYTTECRIISSGGTETWSMCGSNEGTTSCEPHSYPFLGGGRYAAVVGIGGHYAVGSLVKLDAPSLSVIPTENVTTERSDGTMTVTSDRWYAAADSESRSQTRLVLEQASTADQQLIAEQVMRQHNRGYRNTLAHITTDVGRVVLRTDDEVADWAIGYENNTTRFRYEGQASVSRSTAIDIFPALRARIPGPA